MQLNEIFVVNNLGDMEPSMFLQVALCNHPHIQPHPGQATVSRIQHWRHNTYQAGNIYHEASDLCP